MRKTTRSKKLARQQLDKKLQLLSEGGIYVPSQGWIFAIREALGMSQSQLAERLGVARQTVSRIEKSEISGNLEIKTLRKVAQALGCNVGYVFLPKVPLEAAVQNQALVLARRIIEETEKHMRLEKQGTGQKFQEAALVELAAELAREGGKKIWSING
jgi:predicted DNA-binding mobile mystery protein A